MAVRRPVVGVTVATGLGGGVVVALAMTLHVLPPLSGAAPSVVTAMSHPLPSPLTVPAALPAASPVWSAAGALFDGTPDELGDHYCSASVVDSPAGDVVMTAAHCVAAGDGSPARTGMLFVPGYHDRDAPFGAWTVTAAVVDPRWQDAGDPDLDVAFLTVARDGAGSIEALTGGYRLVTDPGPVNDVQAIGYPDGSDGPTVRSGATTRPMPSQLELEAPGLYDGTSGGPWVRDDDEVVGVTGGYEQGGLTPDVSYASYLDQDVRALLNGISG